MIQQSPVRSNFHVGKVTLLKKELTFLTYLTLFCLLFRFVCLFVFWSVFVFICQFDGHCSSYRRSWYPFSRPGYHVNRSPGCEPAHWRHWAYSGYRLVPVSFMSSEIESNNNCLFEVINLQSQSVKRNCTINLFTPNLIGFLVLRYLKTMSMKGEWQTHPGRFLFRHKTISAICLTLSSIELEFLYDSEVNVFFCQRGQFIIMLFSSKGSFSHLCECNGRCPWRWNSGTSFTWRDQVLWIRHKRRDTAEKQWQRIWRGSQGGKWRGPPKNDLRLKQAG